MDHDVYTELKRTLQVRRHKCFVANNASAGSMRYFASLRKIGDDHHRISGCLNEDHSGVLLDCALYVERVRRVNEIKLEVVVGEDFREQTGRAAVSVIRDHDVLAGFYETKCRIDGRHPGSEGETKPATLQRRDVLLEG